MNVSLPPSLPPSLSLPSFCHSPSPSFHSPPPPSSLPLAGHSSLLAILKISENAVSPSCTVQYPAQFPIIPFFHAPIFPFLHTPMFPSLILPSPGTSPQAPHSVASSHTAGVPQLPGAPGNGRTDIHTQHSTPHLSTPHTPRSSTPSLSVSLERWRLRRSWTA